MRKALNHLSIKGHTLRVMWGRSRAMSLATPGSSSVPPPPPSVPGMPGPIPLPPQFNVRSSAIEFLIMILTLCRRRCRRHLHSAGFHRRRRRCLRVCRFPHPDRFSPVTPLLRSTHKLAGHHPCTILLWTRIEWALARVRSQQDHSSTVLASG